MYFFKYEVDTSIKDDYGKTAYEYAYEKGFTEIAEPVKVNVSKSRTHIWVRLEGWACGQVKMDRA